MRITHAVFLAALLASSPLSANDHQHHATIHSDTTVKTYQATGTVKQWNTDSVTISHHPIADLQWPAMTMAFRLPQASEKFAPLPAGAPVVFSFTQSDSGYTLTAITSQPK